MCLRERSSYLLVPLGAEEKNSDVVKLADQPSEDNVSHLKLTFQIVTKNNFQKMMKTWWMLLVEAIFSTHLRIPVKSPRSPVILHFVYGDGIKIKTIHLHI